MRRIGVLILIGLAADDPEGHARLAAFAQGLQQAGWVVSHNVRIDYCFGAANPVTLRKQAAEFVSLDVILAYSSAAVAPLLMESRTDCVHAGCRSGRRRLRRKPGAFGRQRTGAITAAG